MSITQYNNTKKRLKRCWLWGAVKSSALAIFFQCGPNSVTLSFLLSQTVSLLVLFLLRPYMLLQQRSKAFSLVCVTRLIETVHSSWDPGPSRVASCKETYLEHRGTHTGWPPWEDLGVKGQTTKTESSLGTTVFPGCRV